ncbi:hypothetical protein CMO96_02885 [Candidatus Woesebacteria bacterium]|nr:hypothetical protein [Candidatus Woesebacteria bacterium]
MQKLLELFKSNQVFKYGVAAILLVIPLYPKFPLFNIPGISVAVRVEDFLIAALAAFWLAYLIKDGIGEFFKSTLNKALLLFFGVGLLSLLGGIFITETVIAHVGFLHWIRRIEYLIPFFIALMAMRRGANVKFFGETLFIVSFVAFLYGIGQIYAGLPVISTQNAEYAKGFSLHWTPGARLHSTFAGHYDLAAFLVMFFPIAIAFWFAMRNWWYRVFLFFVIISPAFWLLMRSESRISFIAYLVGVSVTLWLIRKKIFILPFVVLSIVAMATFSDLGAKYFNTVNIYKGRIINNNLINWSAPVVLAQESTLAPVVVESPPPVIEDRSTSIRINAEWPRAIRSFSKNPVLGTGYSSITLATDNDYLRALGEIGIVGSLAFLLVLVRLTDGFGRFLRKAQNLDINTAFVGGFVGSFIGILINAMFIDVFEASKVAIIFWTLAGIAVGLVAKSKVAK